MNTPMYTPFFIHPTQKKRIILARKRNLLNHDEEGYAPVYEPRARRSVVSGEWAPETSIVAYHTRSKRQVDSEREMRQKNSSEGIHDVAAEVEVNVEDDIGESDSPPPKQIYSTDGSSSEISKNNNLHLAGSSDITRQFNPENCNDLLELRSRLYAACNRIESLTRLNISMSKLKQENIFLKNELSKRDTSVAQLKSIVLERNMRLKQLLSENVLMSARIKRIQSEFGVDAVKEIFNRDKV